MAFGIKALRKKEQEKKEYQQIFIDHLIVGDDFYSALLFCYLIKKHGLNKVLWISENPEDKNQIEDRWQHFSFLNTSFIDEDFAHSLFYKDQEFKSFTGKSKPQKMSELEERLKGKIISKSWEELILELDVVKEWNHFNELVKTNRKQIKILKVEKGYSLNLVEAQKIVLSTAKNKQYLCEDIYWLGGIKKIRTLINRQEFSSDEIEVIETLAFKEKEIASFVIHYEHESAKDLEILKKKVFIPVSQSQEEGYFIGDINEFHSSFFYHFPDGTEELNKELVTKRLKKLKRNLERILKVNIFNTAKESFYFSPKLFILNEKDQELEEIKHLHFLMKESSSNLLLTDKIDQIKSL